MLSDDDGRTKGKGISKLQTLFKNILESLLTLTHQEAIQLPLNKLDGMFKIILKC